MYSVTSFCLNFFWNWLLFRTYKNFRFYIWFVSRMSWYYFRRPSVAQLISLFRGKLAFLRKKKIRCITESRLSERTCSRASRFATDGFWLFHQFIFLYEVFKVHACSTSGAIPKKWILWARSHLIHFLRNHSATARSWARMLCILRMFDCRTYRLTFYQSLEISILWNL